MTVAAAAVVLVVPALLAQPAGAKGPESATITGVGLDEPIEVFGGEADDQPSYLVIALKDLTDMQFWDPTTDLPAEPPTDKLRDKYTLTWVMSRPHDADPADYTVRQDLYPDASTGPVVYTHPGRYRGAGGWMQANPALRETLLVLGVPVTVLPYGVAESLRAPAPPSDPQQAAEPVWPVPAAATVGVALGAAAGVALTKRHMSRRLVAASDVDPAT